MNQEAARRWFTDWRKRALQWKRIADQEEETMSEEQAMYETCYSERYRNDPVFHRMVDTLVANHHAGIMDTQSVKDAAELADWMIVRHELSVVAPSKQPITYYHPRGEGTAG